MPRHIGQTASMSLLSFVARTVERLATATPITKASLQKTKHNAGNYNKLGKPAGSSKSNLFYPSDSTYNTHIYTHTPNGQRILSVVFVYGKLATLLLTFAHFFSNSNNSRVRKTARAKVPENNFYSISHRLLIQIFK